MQRQLGKTRSPIGNDKRTENPGLFFAHTQADPKLLLCRCCLFFDYTSWLKTIVLPYFSTHGAGSKALVFALGKQKKVKAKLNYQQECK